MLSTQYREQLGKRNKPYLSIVLKGGGRGGKWYEGEAPEGTMAWKAVGFGGLRWTPDQGPIWIENGK